MTTVSGLESRRVESLWDFLAEKYNIHIEFFPPQYTSTEETLQGNAPSLALAADSLGLGTIREGIGGLGAVKSIDINTERESSTVSTTASDTTAVFKTETEESKHEHKTAEAGHDNGTVAIVSAAATLVLALLAFLLFKYFRR